MKNRIPLIPSTRLTASFTAALAAVALLLCGNVAQAQPTITGTYPNGTNLFQPSAQLSFTASSPATITNVSVSLKTTSIATGSSFFQTLTPGSGLTVTGPSTNETVTATLKSNKVYSATITITDGNGVSTNSTVNFDTVSPSYTWEAEDWDYSSGLFHDNPQVNAYAGAPSTSGVDFVYANGTSGPSAYRPQGVSTEGAGDVPRLAYIGTTNIDYDIGFGHTNTWCNYTRHYPAGTYNLYMRGADGNGTDADSARVTVQTGTATIAGTAPYTFSVPSAGWQTYFFVPAIGADGKLAQVTFDGTQSTLQIFEDGGDMNANFYMLVPADTNIPVIATTITNIYPDGTVQFQPTNNLTFTANSSNGIDPTGITVLLSGTNLLGVGYTSNLTSANGLVVTGTSTNRNVSTVLKSNTMYTVLIQVIDGSGNPVSTNVTFDTISPAYTFEAEDFDYGSGLFVDNPQTNAYTGVAATEGIDDLTDTVNNAHSFAYRGGAIIGYCLNNETAGDKPRTSYLGTGFIDYDIGWNSGGEWGNYTRHYPAGTYNVYLRGANGGVNGPNNSGAGQAQLSLVTSGVGTTNQTVSNMGVFTILSTGNWQKYVWWPLLDPAKNLVKFTGGSLETLRVTTLGGASGGSYNANFYMLVPADTTLPVISGLYPDGTSLFQYTNKLKFVASSAAGIATNSIVVHLDGANAAGVAFSGTSNSWNVSLPVSVNASHTVAITITDANGNTASSSVTFDTFQASDYQWEAEDYDYTSNGVSGLFFDNPQVGSYFDLPSTAGIDNVQSDLGANPFNYRNVTITNGLSPATTLAGDLARAQFTGTNVDYNIGFFGPGSWVNFTRHYPAGTYNVWERYGEGGSLTESTLSRVTSGYGTSNQITSLLGTFTNVVGGWSIWTWAPLVDGSGNTVKVTLDGSRTTLQLGGSPTAGHSEVNVNFLILAPVAAGVPVRITATISGGNIQLSFPTAVGSSYQVQYKNALTDATWTNLGSPISGNGSTMSTTDAIGGSSRFYKLQIQ